MSGWLYIVASSIVESPIVSGIHAALLAAEALFTFTQLAVALGQLLTVSLFALVVTHTGNGTGHVHHIIHHLVHPVLIGPICSLTTLTLGIQTGILFTTLLVEQFAGATFVFGAVTTLCIGYSGLSALHSPHLLVREVASALPLQALHLFRVAQLLLLHLGFVAALVFTSLLLGILHGHELLELGVIILTLQVMLAFQVVVIHIATTLLHVELGIGQTALLIQLTVEAAVGILILQPLQVYLLAGNEQGILALTLQTGTFKLDAILQLHHGQSHTALIGFGGDALLQHLKLLIADQTALGNLGQSSITLFITACFAKDTLVAHQQLKLGQLILIQQVLLLVAPIDHVELTFQFEVGCCLMKALGVGCIGQTVL